MRLGGQFLTLNLNPNLNLLLVIPIRIRIRIRIRIKIKIRIRVRIARGGIQTTATVFSKAPMPEIVTLILSFDCNVKVSGGTTLVPVSRTTP